MKARRCEIISYICGQIDGLYSAEECRIIARMVAAEWSGQSEVKFLTEPNETIEIADLERLVRPLTEGRPVQYVIGRAEFCGYDFAVREGVLIPRPETEELVAWALEQADGFPSPRILDICTGSGCIAIALKKRLADSTVEAIDLSDDALAIASENAERLGAAIAFRKDNALTGLESLQDKFDIIVSNPPYIPRREREAMHINVTAYEPEMALFVEDDDPLIFYREIARAAHRLLSDNGRLMFEIHQTLSTQTVELLREEGYTDIELRYDIRQNPRMICCRQSRK